MKFLKLFLTIIAINLIIGCSNSINSNGQNLSTVQVADVFNGGISTDTGTYFNYVRFKMDSLKPTLIGLSQSIALYKINSLCKSINNQHFYIPNNDPNVWLYQIKAYPTLREIRVINGNYWKDYIYNYYQIGAYEYYDDYILQADVNGNYTGLSVYFSNPNNCPGPSTYFYYAPTFDTNFNPITYVANYSILIQNYDPQLLIINDINSNIPLQTLLNKIYSKSFTLKVKHVNSRCHWSNITVYSKVISFLNN